MVEEQVVLIFPDHEPPTRIDSWLAAQPFKLSRSKVQGLIKKNKVLVNEQECNNRYQLTPGDKIRIFVPPTTTPADPIKPKKMPLDILFEDEHLIVINKPFGISVHPGAGEANLTIVEGVLAHTKKLSYLQTELERPGIVHRLDKDTTGALVLAKTDQAHDFLANQFANKTNHRRYLALLDGVLDQTIIHESFLIRDPKQRLRFKSISFEECEQLKLTQPNLNCRWAKSRFDPISIFAHTFSLAQVTLHTGRTHQIRVHSQALNLPIIGDPLYNKNRTLPSILSKEVRSNIVKIKRQMLHAAELGFIHPTTNEKLIFKAPMPADFSAILNGLQPFEQPVS